MQPQQMDGMSLPSVSSVCGDDMWTEEEEADYPRASTPNPLSPKKTPAKASEWILESGGYRQFSENLEMPPKRRPLRGLLARPARIIGCHLVMHKRRSHKKLGRFEEFNAKLKTRIVEIGTRIKLFFKELFKWNKCADNCRILNCHCKLERSLMNKRIVPDDDRERVINWVFWPNNKILNT